MQYTVWSRGRVISACQRFDRSGIRYKAQRSSHRMERATFDKAGDQGECIAQLEQRETMTARWQVDSKRSFLMSSCARTRSVFPILILFAATVFQFHLPGVICAQRKLLRAAICIVACLHVWTLSSPHPKIQYYRWLHTICLLRNSLGVLIFIDQLMCFITLPMHSILGNITSIWWWCLLEKPLSFCQIAQNYSTSFSTLFSRIVKLWRIYNILRKLKLCN